MAPRSGYKVRCHWLTQAVHRLSGTKTYDRFASEWFGTGNVLMPTVDRTRGSFLSFFTFFDREGTIGADFTAA